MKQFFRFLPALAFACTAAADGPRVDVLFIGNSYTAQIRKPLQQVFESAGVAGRLEFITPGGCTLQKHAANPKTLEKIASRKWDFVVLQEQSQIPSLPGVQTRMYPHAETLHRAIARTGARTVLYLSWGRKQGDQRNRPGDRFEDMQERLNRGYLGLAKKLGATVAPVGPAWALARNEFALWKGDGSHPGPHGAYLSACVFLQTLAGISPARLETDAGLPARDAARLRALAGRVRDWPGAAPAK